MTLAEVAPAPLVGENAPMTADEFLNLKEAGAFGDRHVELRRGRVILKMAASDLHMKALAKVLNSLVPLNSNEMYVGSQSTVRLALHEAPEPDAFLVRGDMDDPDEEVGPERILLAVEVSLSTLRDDRTEKAAIYAEAGIPEYWIVNPIGRQVEVRRDPVDGEYRSVTILDEFAEIMPLCAEDRVILTASLMPRPSRKGR